MSDEELFHEDSVPDDEFGETFFLRVFRWMADDGHFFAEVHAGIDRLDGINATPQENSQDGQSVTVEEGVDPENNEPVPASDFARAFPNTQPAPAYPPRSQHGKWKIRSSLAAFWVDNVPESLQTFEIPTENVFTPICMLPTKEQLSTMAARSKCMELLPANHASLLSSPNKGIPLCFVARAAEGLPVHMQKALFFFTSVANSALDLGHYAAPSVTTDVVHDKMEFKAIRRLVSTGVGMEPDPVIRDPLDTQSGFISLNEILRKRQNERVTETKELVPPLSIHVGFTGAVFVDGEGKERREVFAVLIVTPADNFALMPYILEKFLMKPKMGCQKYEQLMELYLESSSFLREIMRYECFCNLGADEGELGLPEDYWLEPGGMLGTSTVLSPFQIPLKVFNTIKSEYPAADLSTIRIIGCPEMTFQRSDDYTELWLKYMNTSINMDTIRQDNLSQNINQYDSSKDKQQYTAMKIGHPGGWPLETDESDNRVTVFGLPPLPLMHRFDANGARGNFSVFIASIGDADQALPDLTRAILTAFLVHSSDVQTRPEIDHLLKDKRKANPLLVLRTYYGPDADPFSALVLANRQRMWAEALRSDIQVRRAKGAPIQEVLRITRDYLASVTKNLESMIECQVFRSATVTQMKAVFDLMPYDEVCTRSPHSIANTLRQKSEKISKSRRYDSVYRSWHSFMKIWEDMNRFFCLNAGNLLAAVEVMLSQLMFKFAHTNDTWTFFFVTIVVMAGNGHFQSQTPDGPVPCRIKPNTTGMDFLLARVMEIWNALYDKLMIPPKDRHNLILNCMRYTATVWENLVTAQAAAGRLVAVPPPDANFQAMSLTEIRDSLKSLIQYGPPRNEQVGQTVSFNSQEVNTTRVASVKRKLGNNNLVVLASNVGSKNAEQKEEGNTLDVVCHVLPSGVPPPTAKRMRTELNDTETNANTARNQPLENQEAAVNCIAYTSNFAALYVGLLNHIGAFPTEVNSGVGSYLDWGFFYIKQYASSSMDVFVRDNFSRMREGYKSRGVIMSIWLKTLHVLSLGKPKDETIQHLWMDIHTDALAMTCVPLVFCNLLYRGVHMGSLIMANMFATHLHVPVISIKHLNAFFDMDRPPDMERMEPGFREDYVQIQEFIRFCFLNNRFCPPEDSPLCPMSNISCYISGDATADFLPVNPKTSLMRVPMGKDKDETHDISHKIALRIAAQYGEELFGQCHMGPEVSTYRLALVYLAERFAPDFRGLMSPNMFCSRLHLNALGLDRSAPGMPDHVDSSHPPFARQFNIRVREQIQSQAIGLNVWSLLTVVSLIGNTDITPEVSNNFANSLVEIILSHAPASCTPGDVCVTPRFGPSTQPVKLYVPTIKERPKHFLRPNEPSFVRNGVLPIAKACGRFAPEDMMHAPQLCAVAKQLHCDVMEVPANAFTVSLLFFFLQCLLDLPDAPA